MPTEEKREKIRKRTWDIGTETPKTWQEKHAKERWTGGQKHAPGHFMWVQ
jgi:hypothetical protein